MKYQPREPDWLKDVESQLERLKAHGIEDKDRINFYLLVHRACYRPSMFVERNSFPLLAAFLNGYDYALDTGLEPRRPWGLTSFSYWLGQRLELPRNIGWSYNLSQMYPDESVAFAQLPLLYEEFLIEQQANPSIQSPI